MTASPVHSRRDLVERLADRRDRLSPSLRQVAAYVLRHYREVAFMGVAELARATGVSPAAVVRFAASLDFGGYPPFQRAIRGIVRSELRQVDRFTASLQDRGHAPLPRRVLQQELDNLVTLRARLDPGACGRAARRLARAPRVAVLGFRASATLAHYLWYNLRKVRPDVTLHTQPGSVTLDELVLAPAGTLVVVIAFPRYARELVEAAALVHGAGRPTLGITDNELSPVVPFCRDRVLVEVAEVSFTDFYAAPIALLNALVAEVARRTRRRAQGRLTQLDDVAAARGYLFPAVPPRPGA